MAQEEKLEDKLLKIGNLASLSRGLDKARKPSEYSQIYEYASMLLANEEEGITKKDILRELTTDPSHAYTTIEGGAQIRAEEIKTDYSTQKARITKEIADKIDESLKGHNKPEAASIAALYLEGLFDTPELDQATANRYAEGDLERSAMIPYSLKAEGSIERYREQHESLQARINANNYLNGDDKKGYSINREKLGKVMDKAQTGAVVYSNMKRIEMAKAIEAKKKAEKKK